MARLTIPNGHWNVLTVIDGPMLIVAQPGDKGEELITIGDEALSPLIMLLEARRARIYAAHELDGAAHELDRGDRWRERAAPWRRRRWLRL